MNITTSTSKSLCKMLGGLNEFAMVVLVNKRIAELMHGAKPLAENSETNYLDIAITEILAGKIKAQR